MWVTVLRSSEFWVGLVAVVLQFLVSQGLVTQQMSDIINMAAVYVLARLLGKAAKAVVPTALLAFAFLVVAPGAHAQEVPPPPPVPTEAPILSMKRVSLATGANFKWYDTEARKAWNVGVYGAYNLTPHLSLVGSAEKGLDRAGVEGKVGVRIRIFQGAKE